MLPQWLSALPLWIQKATNMIHYITGGARSGKSSYAMQLALSLSDSPVYVATARRWDDQFEQRIHRHVHERDAHWTTFEEEKAISTLDLAGKVAVIDCVTLWLTNYFVDFRQDIDQSLAAFQQEIDALAQIEAILILISNEIGMGVHAATEAGRKFTDLQGWANQYVAQKADKATLMVSGLPVVLKDNHK